MATAVTLANNGNKETLKLKKKEKKQLNLFLQKKLSLDNKVFFTQN